MRNLRQRTPRRSRRFGGLAAGILIVCAYLLAFPSELDPELMLRRAWAVSLNATATGGPHDGEASRSAVDGVSLPFTLGEAFGFVDPEGDLYFRGRALFGVTLDQYRFANYSRVSESSVVQAGDGEVLQTIPQAGYPFLAAGRTLVFGPDGRSLSEWDREGRELWNRHFGSLITDIDVVEDALGIGFLDGSVGLLIEEGSRMLRFEPRGSRIEVMYGVAVNEDASDLATVSGLDPQRLTVLETSSDGLTPVLQRELPEGFRRPVFLRFVTRDLLLLEQPDGVILIQPSENRDVSVPVAGRVVQVAYLSELSVIGVITRDGVNERGEAHFYLMRPSGKVILHRAVGPGAVSLSASELMVVLGITETLLGIAPYEG